MGLERYDEIKDFTKQDFKEGKVRRVVQVKGLWDDESMKGVLREGVLTVPTEEVLMIREVMSSIYGTGRPMESKGFNFEVCLKSMGWVVVMCKNKEDMEYKRRTFELMLQEKE